jgi:hypothetical protein
MTKIALAVLACALGACGSPCDDKAGSVTCGYCKQDAVTSGNPNAGLCRYCASGSTCVGDVCGDLTCVSPGGGGGGGGGGTTCAPGNTCINNLCSPGLWCCAAGHSCNMSHCGCN